MSVPGRCRPTRRPRIPTTTSRRRTRSPATEAFAFTGASFLDDAPTGRLRTSANNHSDGNGLRAEAAALYEPHEADELPLGLPPERERTARQKSRRRAWIATLVIFTLLVLAGGGLWLYNTVNQACPRGAQGADPRGGRA